LLVMMVGIPLLVCGLVVGLPARRFLQRQPARTATARNRRLLPTSPGKPPRKQLGATQWIGTRKDAFWGDRTDG
jgi:hypothetical protein